MGLGEKKMREASEGGGFGGVSCGRAALLRLRRLRGGSCGPAGRLPPSRDATEPVLPQRSAVLSTGGRTGVFLHPVLCACAVQGGRVLGNIHVRQRRRLSCAPAPARSACPGSVPTAAPFWPVRSGPARCDQAGARASRHVPRLQCRLRPTHHHLLPRGPSLPSR